MNIINWPNACSSERRFQIAMCKLFLSNPSLAFVVLDPEKPQLRENPATILTDTCGMSSGERVLVRLALDLWNDSGNVRVQELVSRLDAENFENAIAAIQHLGPSRGWPHE